MIEFEIVSRVSSVSSVNQIPPPDSPAKVTQLVLIPSLTI
jgi:hypothetical protein